MSSATRKILTLATTALILSATGVSVARAEPIVKLLVESQYGADVNATTAGNYCTVASHDTCQAGLVSTIPGGFGEDDPQGVAVNNDPTSPDYGNIYAADTLNHRVQELTPTGKFVLMFGKEVNETTHGNVCTQEEIESKGVKCKAGVSTEDVGEPDAFAFVRSLTVDPESGNVYVSEVVYGEISGNRSFGERVQEFTLDGQFVLEIGKEVNETAHKNGETVNENRCPVKAGDLCKGPEQREDNAPNEWGAVHGAFNFTAIDDNYLAVGGPEDPLYVGDEQHVQEFDAKGEWKGEIPLTSISAEPGSNVLALAVNNAGEVYLTYGIGHTEPGSHTETRSTNVVRKFDANGKQVAEFVVSPREAGRQIDLSDMALDSAGRLAVIEGESTLGFGDVPNRYSGVMLNTVTGKPITSFTVLSPAASFNVVLALAFSGGGVGSGEVLYAGSDSRRELTGYVPKEVAELLTDAAVCREEGEHETSAALECELAGSVNPENVANTEVSFLWGNNKALSGPETRETAKQDVATSSALVPVSPAVINGVRPNETIYDELTGNDELVKTPEQLTGEVTATVTPLVAPKIVSAPVVSFIKPFSVDMFGELNPENANTEYFFEYGPGETLKDCPLGIKHESCPGVASTMSEESAAYGKLEATLEASGLQPATLYHYRLVGENENTARTEKRSSLETPNPGDEGSFTTAPAPVPAAVTGTANTIGATFATISGTVNPDGQPASYRFELGVANGALTQYATVFSGSAGTGEVPVSRTLALSGLQPGTTYAYRIFIQSGYGEQYGQTATFTTTGLPDVLLAPTVLAQLPIPRIVFPAAVTVTGTVVKSSTKALTKAQKLARAIEACKKKSKHQQRAACEKQARGKYAKSKQANDHKKG